METSKPTNRFECIAPRRVYVEVTSYPAEVIMDILLMLNADKFTGQLTVNFSQGVPCGTVECKCKKSLVDITTTVE